MSNDKKCKIPDSDPLFKNSGCSSPNTVNATDSSCNERVPVGKCNDTPCPKWELVDTGDDCIIDNYVSESIAIGGAELNVYRLLGVHEQDALHDVTGLGKGISSGHIPNYPEKNAFDKLITEWRSLETGSELLKKGWLGYDFGELRLPNGRLRYGIETFIKRDITTINIKQSCSSKNRATKIRVERSNDGKKWYGVSLLDLPDCDGLTELNFKKTVPSRFWRVRPISFNGGESDWWSIQALQLSEFTKTDLSNIQDMILLENREREYAYEPSTLKGAYIPVDDEMFLQRTGLNKFVGADGFAFEVSFSDVVSRLGRPMVVGDIIQLPSETQYTPRLDPVLKFLEVSSVTWSTNGFTPGWRPTIQKIVAKPALATQETQSIFGDLRETIGESGLADINDGADNRRYQDYSDASQTADAEANTLVPENGQDVSQKTELSPAFKDWVHNNLSKDFPVDEFNRSTHVTGRDAMPPNGENYTQGDELPDVNAAKDCDYHRLTYDSIDPNIPVALYRFSSVKKQWVFLEQDTRYKLKNAKRYMTDFIDESASKTNPHKSD